jgi:hypothetical protein
MGHFDIVPGFILAESKNVKRAFSEKSLFRSC